ncbi:hypothetical protein C2845_PM13G12550 [Panicum miliaceum]|uniref:Uncharacterized protein n=1 Tax=Panicum miliaceum TaxID=4540 RepID=A0A3L6RHF5_PANMI|nr:hypothetical protein C2845_PM13G12550 [Panicum miliaceum]
MSIIGAWRGSSARAAGHHERRANPEERLLRRMEDNWCGINDSTAPPPLLWASPGRMDPV